MQSRDRELLSTTAQFVLYFPTMRATNGIRSFRCLVGAQFFGAFNDNLFKQLILFLAANTLFPGQDKQGLAFAVFALPFVLFSGFAGDLSERISKRTVIILMKVAEVGIMVMAVVALPAKSWSLLLVVLFIMGTQSAVFGPSKYGVIPELVAPRDLLRANGTIAMTTFLAVLLGQALAGPLMDAYSTRLWLPGLACVAFAVVGTAFAVGMVPLAPLKPKLRLRKSPFGSLPATIASLRRQHGLMQIVVLHSLFWFNGGVLQQAIIGLGEPGYLDAGEGEKRLLSYVLVTLALAIMAGTVAAPRLVRLATPSRLVVIGILGACAGQLLLALVGPVLTRGHGAFAFTHAMMGLIGFCGGLFVVPIQTFLQYAPPPGMRGQTFAVNNFMNFLLLFLAGIYYLVARHPQVGLGPGVTQAVASLVLVGYLATNRKAVERIGFEQGPGVATEDGATHETNIRSS